MIVLDDVNWSKPGIKANRVLNNMVGQSLCLIINSVVIEILPIDIEVSEMLISSTAITECDKVGEYFCVNIEHMNGSDVLLVNEKVQAILLSDPGFAPILESHKYKESVAVGWSYIDGEFVIPGEME